MKSKLYKKILLLFIIMSLSVIFTSCRKDCHEWPGYFEFDIEFKESYNPNEDIYFTISMGITPKFKPENSTIDLSYSKENYKDFNNDNVYVLHSITDFSEDYYYSKKGKKIIYNFNKEVVIHKEYFADGSGEITFMMYTTYGDYSQSHSSTLYNKFKYEIKDNKLYFTYAY